MCTVSTGTGLWPCSAIRKLRKTTPNGPCARPLASQRALDELNARNAAKNASRLIARIGLESGQVVVDATGAVFGEAPNIAARVQSLAEPGAVIVTAEVQRQIAGLFVAEERGAHGLKGVPNPVTLYRIMRASGGGRRGGGRVMTPLVGRERELELLSRHWERARAGEGQLVARRGRAGHREIQVNPRVSRSARRNAPHMGGMVVVAAVAKYAVASDRGMGPPTVRRRRCVRPTETR